MDDFQQDTLVVAVETLSEQRQQCVVGLVDVVLKHCQVMRKYTVWILDHSFVEESHDELADGHRFLQHEVRHVRH